MPTLPLPPLLSKRPPVLPNPPRSALALDRLLRDAGYEIFSRPRRGSNWWRLGKHGLPVTEAAAARAAGL